MLRTVFILNDPPDDSERRYNGLRLAKALNDLPPGWLRPTKFWCSDRAAAGRGCYEF